MPIAESYVYRKDSGEVFFVSTADRASSAAAAYGSKYAETMVFTWDITKNEFHRLVHQSAAAQGSIRRHNEVCELLRNGGADALDPPADS